MAGFNVTMRQERRICTVQVPHRKEIKEEKAIFHGFFQVADTIPASPLRGGHPGGQVSNVHALVELEDGRVLRASPDHVRFLDSKAIFEQYAWDEIEEAEAET